jgi:hypothetical protein
LEIVGNRWKIEGNCWKLLEICEELQEIAETDGNCWNFGLRGRRVKVARREARS